MSRYKEIPIEVNDDIIAYFNANKDNRTIVIAKHFDVKQSTVNKIIDKYLKTKQ